MRPRRFAPRRKRRWLRRWRSVATRHRFMPRVAKPAGWSRKPGPRLLRRLERLPETSCSHRAAPRPMHWRKRRGCGGIPGGRFSIEAIRTVGVTRAGVLDLDQLRTALEGGGPALVSVMLANNETGAL